MATKNNPSTVVNFVKAKETKGTWVYSEVDPEGNEPMNPAVGTLYVKKPIVAALGNPTRLQVTITSTD